jgi:hypothetical protein
MTTRTHRAVAVLIQDEVEVNHVGRYLRVRGCRLGDRHDLACPQRISRKPTRLRRGAVKTGTARSAKRIGPKVRNASRTISLLLLLVLSMDLTTGFATGTDYGLSGRGQALAVR